MSAKARPRSPSASDAEPRRGRGRPPSIDQQKLLDVARDVFLEKGIRATTLEVAERAGVSEGAIFHRFKTKDALFREAMGFDVGAIPVRIASALEAAQQLELRDALHHVASVMLEIGREAVPMMMMSWSNPDADGQLQCDSHRQAFEMLIKQFGSYFEAQMDAGHLRRMDGEIVTRVFMGALHQYRMTKMIVGEGAASVVPEGMFVRGLVDLIVGNSAPIPAAVGSNRRIARF